MQNYMMLYVWEDTDTPETELKFGEHWCEAASEAEAVAHTYGYIRNSLGRQKHKFDEGRVIVHHVWNASEYAKLFSLYRAHSKVDDKIRNKLLLGTRVGNTEVHRDIDIDTFIYRVNQELIAHNQPLPIVKLHPLQARVVQEIVEAYDNGAKVILAELAARYGKTIFAGATAIEIEAPLTIVVSYVLTSFASFQKDLSSFHQFRNLKLVDTKDEDYQEQIDTYLEDGYQVVAFLSMCGGGKREDRLEFLYTREVPKFTVVDEADFGVHKPNQVQPLLSRQGEDDLVVLMTGTNGDRAASLWNVDYYTSVTYPELLIEKKKFLALV